MTKGKKELLKWTKTLKIGVDEIDDQHKRFIGLMNEAYIIQSAENKAKIEKELNDLMEYARIHFTTEENYFQKWGYPYAEEHMKEHAKLLENVLNYKSDFDAGKLDFPKFLLFLKDWLENHLKKHDFKYRDYFIKQGFIGKFK
jgi:hemerythrin-like metal-binding protein